MAAAADGDRGALAPLFQSLWPTLVGYATRFVGNRALAEDCAQDALIQLFGQLDRYDRERDALTWALTLTTWQCRTVRRRQARRSDGPPLGGVDGPSLDGCALVEHRDLVRAALATLDDLSARDVETLAIAVTDADRTAALAPATYRKRLERALSRLRTSWRSRHGTL
jgi:RNA polymerase sigma-70 factor (ECF subfamily)